MGNKKLTSAEMNSIFHECTQCGSCCKKYEKVYLEPDEVDTIKRLGGHVGVIVHLADLRDKKLDELTEEERAKHKQYMIHSDHNGCMFLEKRDGKYYCKIYNYRPDSCRKFKCNLADSSMSELLFDNPIQLLGMDKYGRKLD